MNENNKEQRKAEKKKSGWYLIWEYVTEHPFIYLFAVLSIGCSSVLAAIIPRLIGEFTDSFKSGKLDVRIATHFALLILVVGFFRVTLSWIGRLQAAQHGRVITYKVREKLFKKWETLSPSYYHGHSVGGLLSHALSDVEVIRQVSSMGINIAVSSLFLLGTSFYFMIMHINLHLAIAGLLPLLAIPGLVKYYGPKIKMQSAKLQTALGIMSQSVEEVIGGIRTVKAFGNEGVIINRFEAKVENIVEERMKFVKLSSMFTALVPLMASIGFVVVISYGGYLTINKTISLGDFVAFILYLTLLRQPLEQLGNLLNIIQRASASLARISELLNVQPAVYDRESTLYDKPVIGNIEVKNLTFRYPGTEKDVLSNVSFTVNKGKTLGIIGSIGSGKTTLAHLLLRLYEPPKGAIFIDGIDVHKFYLDHLRQSIAYVPQNGFLFSTTVEENIAFAEDTINEKKVVDAAKISVVHEDIIKLKEMYNTEIGERGVRLSGGQKQRAAIARMIYKDSPINVLDDSLSAVDTKTERLILKNMRTNINKYTESKTTVIISHRLSAVMHADEIIILDEGRIIERGNHQKLLKAGGLYTKLWDMQSGGDGRSKYITNKTVEETDLLEVLLSEDDEDVKGNAEGGLYGY